MKKTLMIFIFCSMMMPVNNVVMARDICGDYGDKCMEDCKTYYTGETIWDGAGRLLCRADCETSEALCRYGEFLVETF